MIETSVERARRGAELAARVDQALGEIGESTNQVKELLTTIAEASSAEAKGIADISLNVQALDEVTTRTAGQTEEMAAAAEETASQAASLRDIANRYKVSDSLC
jgi:methyl-accepting chemotaxis protein